jgi:opacity protein-like surface antigen
MKTILLAAAASLAIGSAALAQDANQTTTQSTNQPATTTTEQPSGETVDDPSQATGPEGVTQQGTDPNGQATAPAGTNEGVQGTGTGMAQPMPNQQAAFTPRAATTEYPPCSRTVTDGCIQTYERGVRRARRGR